MAFTPVPDLTGIKKVQAFDAEHSSPRAVSNISKMSPEEKTGWVHAEQGTGEKNPGMRGGSGTVLGSMKKGGKVDKTGLYKLHEGETVVAKKEEESKGAKKVLGGKSKDGKKHVHKMHIRRSANKGYIAEHEPLPGESNEPPEANEEHVLPDMDALKAHVEQHMQPEPEEAAPAQAEPMPA